jgi:hypothetical protein
MASARALSVLLVALGGCAHPRPGPDAAAPLASVTVDDAGAPPRRALGYRAVRALDRVVAMTWGGGTRSAGATCLGAWDTQLVFDDVTVTGRVTGELPGRAALALWDGTITPRDNLFFLRAPVELAALVPARYPLVGERGRVEVEAGGDERLRAVVRAALPILPRAAIGVGARWTVTAVDGAGTRRARWTLRAITGDRVTLAGTIDDVAPPPRPETVGWQSDGLGPWHRTTVQVTVDLAAFIVDAEVASHRGTGGWSEDTAATLTIGPRR